MLHHDAEIDAGRRRHSLWRLGERLVTYAGIAAPFLPAPGFGTGHRQVGQGGDGRDGVGLQAQRRPVDTADLIAIGVHMDQVLLGNRYPKQGVRIGGHVAQPGAQRQDQVGVHDQFLQRSIHAEAHVADVLSVAVVQHVLPAERTGHRKIPCAGKTAQVVGGLVGPAAATHDDERTPGAFEHLGDAVQRFLRRNRRFKRGGRERRVASQVGQHVFRQRNHHWTGTARYRRVKGPRDDLAHARSVVNLDHPLRQLAEHRAVVDFLEGLAPHLVASDLPDEQDHRRGVLLGDVDADARVRRARPARHHADARPAGHLAVGLRHGSGPAFVLRNDEFDVVRYVVQGIQHFQITFSGNAEHPVHAVQPQGIHQHAAGGSPGLGRRRIRAVSR